MRRPTEPTFNIHIGLAPKLMNRLRRKCEETHLTQATVVRQALDAYLPELPAEPEPKPRPKVRRLRDTEPTAKRRRKRKATGKQTGDLAKSASRRRKAT